MNEVKFNIQDELDIALHEIHIKVNRKSKRQCLTLIVTKNLKKMLGCGATIRDTTIELMGDHGIIVKDYLIQSNIVTESQIKLHIL